MSLYSFYCRFFQAILKLGNYALGYRTPQYIEGAGCITKLPERILEDRINNVLFVTGPNITKRGLNKSLLDALTEKNISYTMFNDIGPNPTTDMVEAGVKAYHNNNCQGIIAFGGGSPMDCAKAIGARIACPNRTVAQLQGTMKLLKKIPLFYAIPTTSGTGSETTIAAVITESSTHHKAAIQDTALMPDFAVLDPELTLGLPPFTTAITGMDALCHAVEAFTNKTYNTKLEDNLARKAVKLIYENLEATFNNPNNIELRQNMQKAAFFAGRAFTRGCVGYVHAVGHTVSGLYDVSHGLAMAVILPHVLRQFGSSVYDRLSILADDCSIKGLTKEEKALAFIDWIDKANQNMEIPKYLDMIKTEDIPKMIKWAMKESNPLYPVPEIWEEKDFEKLILTVKH